jgi:hypothetical protein
MVEHGFWREKVNLQRAIEILKVLIDKLNDQEGDNRDKVTPPGKCKCLLDTLQYWGNQWFISYNDHTGTTRTAVVTI